MLEGILDNDVAMTAIALTFGFGLLLVKIATALERTKRRGSRRYR